MSRQDSGDIGLRALSALKSSLAWLYEIAKSGKYTDPYLSGLGASGEENYPMPIAECLMGLLASKEESYEKLGLIEVSDADFESFALHLLNALELHGPIGRPYIQPPDDTEDPAFVDSICFALGAIVKLVRLCELDGTISLTKGTVAKLKVRGLALVKLILRGGTSVRLPGAQYEGWSWTTDESADPLRPISIYFTTQVSTTLMEVLFEAPAILIDGRTDLSRKVLTALADARKVIFAGLVYRNDPDKIGWPNLNTHFLDPEIAGKTPEARRSYFAENGYPHFGYSEEGDPAFSLYAVETLAYFDYYNDPQRFRKRLDELRKIGGSTFSEVFSITANEAGWIVKALERFLKTVEAQDREGSLADNLKLLALHLPEGYNAIASRVVSFDEIEKGYWYIDGTLPYTALNALNFSTKQFTEGDAANDSENAERKRRLLEFVLNNAVDEKVGAFRSFTEVEESENSTILPAIYATRAGIATILSLGFVDRAELPGDSVDIVRAKELTNQLAACLGLLHEKSTYLTNGEVTSTVETYRRLFTAIYSVGLVTGYLSNQEEFQRANSSTGGPNSFIAPKHLIKFDPEYLTHANGVEFIDFYSHLVAEPDSTECKRLAESLVVKRHLLQTIRSWLTDTKVGLKKGEGKKGIEPFQLKEGDFEMKPNGTIEDIAESSSMLVTLLQGAADKGGHFDLEKQLQSIKRDLLGG